MQPSGEACSLQVKHAAFRQPTLARKGGACAVRLPYDDRGVWFSCVEQEGKVLFHFVVQPEVPKVRLPGALIADGAHTKKRRMVQGVLQSHVSIAGKAAVVSGK